jgi:hypothetical protein
MTGLTWLHLSDWHQAERKFNRKVVCDALIKDIKARVEINPHLSKIDFISRMSTNRQPRIYLSPSWKPAN